MVVYFIFFGATVEPPYVAEPSENSSLSSVVAGLEPVVSPML